MPDYYEYFYIMDGIRHEIKTINKFPSSVKFVDDEQREIYISPKQQRICKNLKKILLEWIRIADELDIKWFFNGGSLLGVLRDHGLIFYDNDIDLCIQYKDYHKLVNYKCHDGFLLTDSEAGFNLSRSNLNFPFMDIWVIGKDPNDDKKMTVCSPVLDGKPLYYFNKVWPTEWYYKTDLKRLDKAIFEGIEVFIPKNAEQILKRMYGLKCLIEYRIETHTEDHELAGVPLFNVENRMKICKGWKKINDTLCLDRTKNVDGHMSSLVLKTITELTAVSSSNKHMRIRKYLLDYLKAQFD
jgi:hypothetical protein